MEEDYVSMTRVNELLHQQKQLFTALLHQQDSFKGFVKVLMDSTNARLDMLTREMQEIKTSLEYTQKDVDEIKNKTLKL